MRIAQPVSFPPTPPCRMSWRQLYADGRFSQRPLESPDQLRRAAQARGLQVGSGDWDFWDEEGALRPVAFGLGRYVEDRVVDPSADDTIVFREAQAFRPWGEYAIELQFDRRRPQPLYSPWHLLPLHDVTLGRGATLPADALLDPARRDHLVESLSTWLEGQISAWRALDAKWDSTLKLLVRLQNRFWPSVSGRVVLQWDGQGGGRTDPMSAELTQFDPLAVLDEHGLNESELGRTYEWLALQGADIEGGSGSFLTRGGDHWGRLRQLADRRERRALRGPPRMAMDFYEAAEMVGRFWFELTGRYLPAIDAVPKRRTTRLIDYDTVECSTFSRDRRDLRGALIEHGLWPGRVHAVVEGETERQWVLGLVEASLGWIPEELLVTNIRGSGGAKRMEPIVEAIADYAAYTTVIVDAEGEMARYVHALVDAGLADPDNVMMVGTSFEEANFTDAELVRTAKRIAASPPGERPAVKVTLTGRESREAHETRLQKARPGEHPGLADTLLILLRDPDRGPVNLGKVELSRALLEVAMGELGKPPIHALLRKRPIVRFVLERIADPLVSFAWR
jgi:hypothetical protein